MASSGNKNFGEIISLGQSEFGPIIVTHSNNEALILKAHNGKENRVTSYIGNIGDILISSNPNSMCLDYSITSDAVFGQKQVYVYNTY